MSEEKKVGCFNDECNRKVPNRGKYMFPYLEHGKYTTLRSAFYFCSSHAPRWKRAEVDIDENGNDIVWRYY